MRNKERTLAAIKAANFLKEILKIGAEHPIGVILGTGWGDKLDIENPKSISFEEIPGFSKLSKLEGHNRRFVYGTVNGREVIVLQGRIHLNESPGNPAIYKMVRLQTEILMQLGVKTLIVTCAAGSLPGANAKKNHLVIIEGFLTLFAPQMSLWAGEFASPEDTLTERLSDIAWAQRKYYGGKVCTGYYAMLVGPYFEGRKKDKDALANAGATIVGMSVLPEACVAALYPGVEVLPLAFITNDSSEIHSHEANVEEAKKFAVGLSKYLSQVIKVV